jgi:hypothetical protein
VNRYCTWSHHTSRFGEERRQRVDVLQHVRGEDDVDAGIRERDRTSVILTYREEL